MTRVRKSLSQRALAGVSAVALGVAGVAALGSAAFADVGPDQPEAPTNGSLTIHKYLGAPTDPALPNDGTELSSPPEKSTPADGVFFTIQEVGVLVDETCTSINLKTPEGWEQVETATASAPDKPASPYCLKPNTARTALTDNGVVAFGGEESNRLPLGLYYVTEGVDSGNNNIVQKAAPFYVTVPYPSGEQEDIEGTVVEWTYNVHVYPKNATGDKPTKTIDEMQRGLKVGDEVTWTITQTVPTLNEGKTFTQASITDVLDNRLELESATIKLDGTELELTDWEKIQPNHTWSFTPAGRLKLDGAQGRDITIELKTTVISVGSGDTTDVIENGPWDGDKGYKSTFNEQDIPGETTPFTYWGELQVTKVDESRPAKTLDGAEFAVYEAPETGDCPDPATGHLIASGTSGSDGLVKWDDKENTVLGLLIKNSNVAETTPPSKDFCLYETKAPAGYTGAAVQKVTIIAGTLSAANGGEVTVVNTQKEGPDLPLTGANGTMLMILGGIGLVAIAGGVHLVGKRRQEQAA